MHLTFNYKTWRIIKFLVILTATSTLFLTSYWGISLFYSFQTPFVLTTLYIVGVGIAMLAFGSGSVATQQWYESQLFSTHELFATLYDQSPIPYLTLNHSGTITMCNQATSQLFKKATEKLIGQKFTPYISHTDNNKLSVILGTIQAGSSMQRTEAQLLITENETIWIELSIFHSARYNQQLVTVIDINNQKLVDKAKSEFVSLATHQLRTPITAIKWNTDLLVRSLTNTLTEKQTAYIIKIKRNIERMITLINDFLSVSKLETGTFTTTAGPVELGKYINSIIDEYQQLIEEKNLKIYTSFDPITLKIIIDEPLLHIIISNLVSNAVKYTKKNNSINISYTQAENYFNLVIADSGIGIPTYELDNLFTKFFRASNAQLYRTEGTGLGLYVVKESIDKIGGTIQVQSKEAVGTKFSVTLPIKPTK